ncbi:peptidoglycan-binding domain-containing protein [Limnofasciculus baicalensis]|uniref:Peptidoglycan-binding protein n=1 Tax=Limnofasciculus baicalensis BBK-W-15 TaxID=2699891 RepID=A0AAE3GUX1_9CYAN|nr:peptidoglycan-binding domain-containing protein [Limnofasciculus baicalensis]MCP2731135.1 peptidoglycan-binding protein [Limnofasciculus baicalensis BBK-W-15]
MDKVKEVQQYLRKIGFDPGPVNGIYNLQTEVALRHFQAENNLRISGIIDKKTLDKLRQIARVNSHPTGL